MAIKDYSSLQNYIKRAKLINNEKNRKKNEIWLQGPGKMAS